MGKCEGSVPTYGVAPAERGLARASPGSLLGGDAASNAGMTRRVLEGERGACRDIVVLNAAAGIVAGGMAKDLIEGLALAEASIDEGRAGEALDRLIQGSQSPPH